MSATGPGSVLPDVSTEADGRRPAPPASPPDGRGANGSRKSGSRKSGSRTAGPGAPRVAVAALCLPVLALPWGNTEVPGVGTVLILPLTALALVVAAAELLAARRPVVVFSGPLAAAGVTVLLSVVGIFLARDPALALRLVVTTVLGLGWAVLVTAVGRERRASSAVVGLFLAVGAGQCAVALPAAARLQAVGGAEVVNNRLSGSFGQPNELGCFAAVVLVLALGVAVSDGRRAVILAASATAVLAVSALALSLSRGAWLGAALGLLVLVLALPRARPRLAVALASAVLVVTVAVAVSPPGGTLALVGERATTVVDPAADLNDNRLEIWREAQRQIRAAPVLGHGPGSFPGSSRDVGSAVGTLEPAHAHNLALTTAAENGLVGLGALVVMIGTGIATVVRVRHRPGPGARPGLVVAAAGGLTVVLGQGLLDYPLHNAVLAMVTWLLLGLLCAAAGADTTEQMTPESESPEVEP